jgi:CRP-like cAMP-binding protein
MEVMSRLAPGEFFGVVSSASGSPVTASVVATEDTTLLWLPPETLRALKEGDPAFTEALANASHSRVWEYRLTATFVAVD